MPVSTLGKRLANQRSSSSGPSLYVLPPLADDHHAVLENKCKFLLSAFVDSIRECTRRVLLPDLELAKLPLSGLDYEVKPASVPPDWSRRLFAPVIRSPFCALSGEGDEFSTVTDLKTHCAYEFDLEESNLPTPDFAQMANTPLSSVVLDFFKHGQPHALGVEESAAWQLINDWRIIFKRVAGNLPPDTPPTTVATFTYLHEQLADKLKAF